MVAMAKLQKLLYTHLSISVVQFWMVFCNGIENSLPNCAACFSQKWDWDSWQCDVNCNVPYSPYQLVDAFRVQFTDLSVDPLDLSQPQFDVFQFDTVKLNLHNGFDINTGKFTVTVAGVYRFSVQARVHEKPVQINIRVNQSGVNSISCKGWSHTNWEVVYCETLEEMDVGDEAYVEGQSGKVSVMVDRPDPTFLGYLVYRKK